MTEANTSRLTVNSKGQVNLSAAARNQLGIEKGAPLIEVVVGNCLILIPQNTFLYSLRVEAADALKRAGVNPEEIVAEADRIRNERSTNVIRESASSELTPT